MRVKEEHFNRAQQAFKDNRTRHVAFDPELCEVFAEIIAVESAGMDAILAENVALKKRVNSLVTMYVEDMSQPETEDTIAKAFLAEPDGLEDAVDQALSPGGYAWDPGETSNYREKPND